MNTLIRFWTRGLVFGASLILFSSLAHAQEETILDTGEGEYKIEFEGATVADGNTTFTYTVSEIDGKDLSNFLIELCILEEDEVIATDPFTDEIILSPGGDPNFGIAGIKWEVDDDFITGTFSFTLSGVYAVDENGVGAAAKGGTSTDTGFINGPSCDIVCAPEDGPFWDGNFTGNDPTPGQGYFVIDTPHGFDTIELTVHENIAITGLAAADGSAIAHTLGGTTLTGTGVTPVGTTEATYTGTDPLLSARVLVRALETGGSRFMFEVADGCQFTAQLDPVVQLAVPQSAALKQNYPNPFNPQTSISFELPEASSVKLVVYNVLGREVKTLVSREMQAGVHEAVWDGTDASGLLVPSGVYLYRLEAGNVVQIRQMTMLK